jgi:hypothetical protein
MYQYTYEKSTSIGQPNIGQNKSQSNLGDDQKRNDEGMRSYFHLKISNMNQPECNGSDPNNKPKIADPKCKYLFLMRQNIFEREEIDGNGYKNKWQIRKNKVDDYSHYNGKEKRDISNLKDQWKSEKIFFNNWNCQGNHHKNNPTINLR